MHISTIPEIIADIKAGKMVIITDAEDVQESETITETAEDEAE